MPNEKTARRIVSNIMPIIRSHFLTPRSVQSKVSATITITTIIQVGMRYLALIKANNMAAMFKKKRNLAKNNKTLCDFGNILYRL